MIEVSDEYLILLKCILNDCHSLAVDHRDWEFRGG